MTILTTCFVLCCFIIFFGCPRATIYDVQLILTEYKQSWMTAIANKECTLVGTNMTGEVDTNTVRFNLTNKNLNNSAAWIGAYVKYTPWFEFAGCRQGSAKNKSGSNIASSREPVKDCFNRCGGDFVLSEDLCICHTEIEITALKKGVGGCLAKPCRGNNQSFCGYNVHIKNKVICMCFYQMMKQSVSNGSGNCKIIEQYEQKNEDCSKPHHYHCNDISVPFYNYSTLYDPLPWSTAILQCFEQNLPFASWNSSKPIWSGIFRKYSFMWGCPGPDELDYNCLSANIGQDGSLDLGVQQCDEHLPLFCHSSVEPTNSSNGNTSLAQRIDTTMTSIGVTIDSSLENISLVTNVNTKRNTQTMNTASMIIIGAVCFVIGVAVGALSMTFFRRLKKTSHQDDAADQENYTSLNMTAVNEPHYEIPN